MDSIGGVYYGCLEQLHNEHINQIHLVHRRWMQPLPAELPSALERLIWSSNQVALYIWCRRIDRTRFQAESWERRKGEKACLCGEKADVCAEMAKAISPSIFGENWTKIWMVQNGWKKWRRCWTPFFVLVCQKMEMALWTGMLLELALEDPSPIWSRLGDWVLGHKQHAALTFTDRILLGEWVQHGGLA